MSISAKWSIVVIVIILIVAGVWYYSAKPTTPAETGPIKIGAILPLTGPASVWGENARNGMELAKAELSKTGAQVEIIYEDNQGDPAQGVTAYKKLTEMDNVSAIFSILSRPSVPLVSLVANGDKPLIMSIVSAKNVANAGQNSFRFYSSTEQYVDPHMSWITKDKYDSVAILSINDEFGKSVREVLLSRLEAKGIKVVADETFLPNATDMRSQLTKIKSAKPKALIFITAVPGETMVILKQVKELAIKTEVVEASSGLTSILRTPALAKNLQNADGSNLAEGVYTITFPYSIGATGQDFSQDYIDTYGKYGNFAAAFGYDTVKMLSSANSLSGKSLSEKIVNLGHYNSLNGPVTIKSSGEINPITYSAKIVKDQIVPVE